LRTVFAEKGSEGLTYPLNAGITAFTFSDHLS